MFPEAQNSGSVRRSRPKTGNEMSTHIIRFWFLWKCPLAILLLVSAAGTLPAQIAGDAGASAKSELGRQFEHPPESARPRTWWHWVSGNVSAQGITADLEAMKEIGLGGAQLFTVDQSQVKGPVKFMSPQWRGFVHQSLTEAERLGLEMAMEGCDGWSESGGPWIKPEQGMQHVVWTETNVQGGAKISLSLAQPPATRGYYEDIALLGFPTLKGDDLPAPAEIKANVPGVEGSKLGDRSLNTETTLKLSHKNAPLRITLVYAEPVTARSLIVEGDPGLARFSGHLEVSQEGSHYTKVGPITLHGISVFPATSGKCFRLSFPRISSPKLRLSKLYLAGARVDQWAARIGMERKQDLPFTDAALAPDDVIDPATVTNLTGRREWEAPAGHWTLVRIGHTGTGATTHPAAKAGLECDKMSSQVVRFHFDQMFGPVFADSPAQVGKSLRYILLDSWEAGCENWTPLMREQFARRRGYSLAPWLPVFTGRVVKNQEATQRFLWDFRRTLADLVTDCHYGVAQQFAHEHNMGLYAEAPGIHLPTVADNLACKGRTDIPMGEFWVSHPPEGNIDDPKEAAAAAHIYGKPIVATESFTSTREFAAWANDPYGLKALGDMEFCLGVNRFVFHRYAHQPWPDRKPGMSMGPWGINFERSNTWWKQGAAWMDYLSRCQYLLQQGRFVADLLYFYGEGAPARLAYKALKPAVPPGFDYDVCNAEILLDQMSAENGEIALKSGMRYRVLVLPDTDRMTLPVLQKIQSLVRAGATVYGPKPQKSPSLMGPADSDQTIQSIAAEVWGDCDGSNTTLHTYGKGKVLWGGAITRALPAPDFTAAQTSVLFIHRRTAGADIYFVANQQQAQRIVECSFRVSGRVPELWHPDSGRRESLALYRTADGQTTLPIHFDPVGSVFVVFRSPETATPIASVQRNGQRLFAGADAAPAELPVCGSGKINLLAWQPGAYTLTTSSGKTLGAKVGSLPPPVTVEGDWQLSFPPKLGAPATATFDHLISWTESSNQGVKYFSGTATYQKEITIPAAFFARHRRIFLDLGTVKNLAEVRVNGKPLGVLWKAPFRVEITGAARRGKNQLEIRVTNLWPNRLIGDQKLPEAQRITWTSVQLYKSDAPLLPSGLLGPVRILPAQTLSLKQPPNSTK